MLNPVTAAWLARLRRTAVHRTISKRPSAKTKPLLETITGAATVAYGAYLVTLTRTNPPFAVAIAAYVPGALFLSAALATRLQRPAERRSAAPALVGMALTFSSALAQARRIAVHPRLFDHNATYHVIQATALACFFAAADGLVSHKTERALHASHTTP